MNVEAYSRSYDLLYLTENLLLLAVLGSASRSRTKGLAPRLLESFPGELALYARLGIDECCHHSWSILFWQSL